MKLNLTDKEWLQLLDGQSEDSQLQACCPNVSELRDELAQIVRGGRNNELSNYDRDQLMKKLQWFVDGHLLTPLIKKVCEQIEFIPEDGHTN